MDLITKLIVAVLGGGLVTVLSISLTYFFTTKNIESTVTRVIKECILEHNNTEHKVDPWDIGKELIREHKENCGQELKTSLDSLSMQTKSINDTQIAQGIKLENMSNIIVRIEKKLFNGSSRI